MNVLKGFKMTHLVPKRIYVPESGLSQKLRLRTTFKESLLSSTPIASQMAPQLHRYHSKMLRKHGAPCFSCINFPLNFSFAPFITAISNPRLFIALITMSLVCRRWRDTITGAASLWDFLSADFGSSSLLQLAVERSRSFPLVITTGHLKMDVMKFIRAVTPHVRRCRVLCFTPPPSVWNGTEDNEARAAAYNLLSQPCPALKELYLSGLPKSILSRSHQSRMPEVWALENVAKNLKVLSLASMDWYSTPVLSSLQELKLCSVQTSVSTLMTKCLNSASNLRVLDLKDLRLDQDRQDPPLSGPISLDFLQNITISDSSTTEMAQILPHIVTPVLRRLILKAKSSDDSPPFGSNPYYHRLIRSIAATAKGPIQVYVSHNRHSFAMFDTYNDSEVSIEWRGLTSMEAKLNFVKWLADTCNSFSSVASIHLILVNIRLIRDLLVPLTSIHNVTKLQIGEDAVDLRELYRRLSYPILSKGTKDWLFPRMSVLEFTSKDAISGMIDLVQMLKTRCDVGREDEGREGESHGDEGTQPEPPTIFKELVMRERQRDVPELQSVVGVEKLVVLP